METIPTPRTTAFYKTYYDPSVPDVMIEHASGKERDFMRQLESKLHIAKQALEEISFGVCAKNKAGGCAQIELGKLQMQEIADMALTTINTLSA